MDYYVMNTEMAVSNVHVLLGSERESESDDSAEVKWFALRCYNPIQSKKVGFAVSANLLASGGVNVRVNLLACTAASCVGVALVESHVKTRWVASEHFQRINSNIVSAGLSNTFFTVECSQHEGVQNCRIASKQLPYIIPKYLNIIMLGVCFNTNYRTMS